MIDIAELNDISPDEVDEGVGIVQYISGEKDGQSYWAYMVMKPSRYMEYYQLISEGKEIDLADFGEIMEEGFGDKPPQEIQDQMKQYENSPEMNLLIEKLGQEFLDMNKENL